MVLDAEMKQFWSSAFRRKALDLVRWRAARSFSSLNFRPAQTGWSCSKCICRSGKNKNNESVAKEKKKSRATKSVSQHIILRQLFFSLHDHAKHVPTHMFEHDSMARVSSSATQKSQVFPIGTTQFDRLIRRVSCKPYASWQYPLSSSLSSNTSRNAEVFSGSHHDWWASTLCFVSMTLVEPYIVPYYHWSQHQR